MLSQRKKLMSDYVRHLKHMCKALHTRKNAVNNVKRQLISISALRQKLPIMLKRCRP